MNKPMTQREIKKQRSQKENEPQLSVFNSSKTMIPIQLREPGSDFYVSEKSIYLSPGKSYTDRTSLFNEHQIENLRAKGKITADTVN